MKITTRENKVFWCKDSLKETKLKNKINFQKKIRKQWCYTVICAGKKLNYSLFCRAYVSSNTQLCSSSEFQLLQNVISFLFRSLFFPATNDFLWTNQEKIGFITRMFTGQYTDVNEI